VGERYDFQGAGEYVLAEGRGFSVHSRFARPTGTNPAVIFNHGVAAKVGGSIVAFGDDGAKTLPRLQERKREFYAPMGD
jgi:hypothetical protein